MSQVADLHVPHQESKFEDYGTLKPYEAKLASLSKQELIQFIIKKGNATKDNQTDLTRALTQDKENLDYIIPYKLTTIDEKRRKLGELESKKKNYEIEMSGLDIAISAMKEKIKKRDEQYQKSEAFVKRQREETRKILKELNPKLVKKLHQDFTKHKTSDKVNTMLLSFVGLISNAEQSSNEEVQELFKDYSAMMEKINSIDPTKISDSVITLHLDNIKQITKSFIDAGQEDYKKCSPYAAFIAWSSQFAMLCRHSQQQAKVEGQINSLQKELDSKVNKKLLLQGILDQFNKDGLIPLLEKDLKKDDARLAQYKQARQELMESVVEQQRIYVNFEKTFFLSLEQYVVKKKMARNLKKTMLQGH